MSDPIDDPQDPNDPAGGPPDNGSDPGTGGDGDPGQDGQGGGSSPDLERLRREAASWRRKLRDSEAEVAKLKEAHQSEAEKALEQARADSARETATRYNARLLKAEVRSVAAELHFRDPADAVRLVDMDSFEVGEDGEVDAAAIREALKGTAEAKPYLVESAKPDTPSAKDAGLGGGGDPTGKDYSNYTVADFDREFFPKPGSPR